MVSEVPDSSKFQISQADHKDLQTKEASPEDSPTAAGGKASQKNAFAKDSIIQHMGGELKSEESNIEPDVPHLTKPKQGDERDGRSDKEEEEEQGPDSIAEAEEAEEKAKKKRHKAFRKELEKRSKALYEEFKDDLPKRIHIAADVVKQYEDKGLSDEEIEIKLYDDLAALGLSLQALRHSITHIKLNSKILAISLGLKELMDEAEVECEPEIDKVKATVLTVQNEMRKQRQRYGILFKIANPKNSSAMALEAIEKLELVGVPDENILANFATVGLFLLAPELAHESKLLGGISRVFAGGNRWQGKIALSAAHTILSCGRFGPWAMPDVIANFMHDKGALHIQRTALYTPEPEGMGLLLGLALEGHEPLRLESLMQLQLLSLLMRVLMIAVENGEKQRVIPNPGKAAELKDHQAEFDSILSVTGEGDAATRLELAQRIVDLLFAINPEPCGTAVKAMYALVLQMQQRGREISHALGNLAHYGELLEEADEQDEASRLDISG